MSAGTQIKQDRLPRRIENRRNHCDIGQMSTAVIRCVEGEYLSGSDGVSPLPDNGLDALAHGTQMNGQVRCVGDQAAFCVENRAGKIETLLNVHGTGRVGKHGAHLLGN